MHTIKTTVTPEIHERIERAMQRMGYVSKRALLRAALYEFLENHEKDKLKRGKGNE